MQGGLGSRFVKGDFWTFDESCNVGESFRIRSSLVSLSSLPCRVGKSAKILVNTLGKENRAKYNATNWKWLLPVQSIGSTDEMGKWKFVSKHLAYSQQFMTLQIPNETLECVGIHWGKFKTIEFWHREQV